LEATARRQVLFGLAFINFPLFCMGVFLLTHAGFHPTHYIVGLLWMQLMWILLLFLWLTALTTVTKSIVQMLLALLLIVLNIIGASALSSVIHKSDLYGSFDLWWGLVVIIAAAAIILLQYSRRRTALSRCSIVGVCAVLTVISVASSQPTPDRASIVRQYPSIGDLPVQLGLMRTDTHEGQLSPIYNNEVSIQLPVSVTGIPENSFLRLDGMIVTLATANGFRWDSGWKANSQWFFSDQKRVQLSFPIGQSIFDKLSSSPVTADFFLAFTLYQDKSRQEFVVPSGEFRLPDIGLCTAENQYSRGLHCLAPLRGPAFLLVTSRTAASTCLPKNSSPSTDFVHAFVQSYPGWAEIGISPVRPFGIAFSDWDWFARRPVSSGICPGTPLTLSNPEETGRRGIELQIKDLHLDDFRERSPAVP